MTGFAGIKPFKPSSSFGATLLESLPPVPGSAPTTPSLGGSTSPMSGPSAAPTGSPGLGALNAQNTSSVTGSTLGVGLRPQMTGNPAANPFRATMFATTGGGMPTGAGSPFPSATSQPTGINFGAGQGNLGAFGGGGAGGLPNPSMGSSLFGTSGTSAFGSFNSQPQQQQQNASSLI
ncbi:hypothetical protein V5O48_008533 [Marasmius crinis-equi]|uniref:Uncharacterized protein n=1 Tax=Marasmius crinis-equi TaxID=585013 RepID=A0ABR3FDX1_9AGAR